MNPETPKKSGDSGDIADADATVVNMIPSSYSSRRSMVSAMPQAKIRQMGIQCTHTTVTRLFTAEFRCSSCLRVAPLGWLWRCTQDRELLAYDDLERKLEGVKFDKLPDLFELPSTPPKRHPIARLDRLAFFNEVTNEQLKTYSQEQIGIVLKQRAKVLDTAFQSPRDSNSFSSKSYYSVPLTPVNGSFVLQPSPEVPDRPFLPLKGGECQFKVCHYCRQHSVERSFLSLNGIADGDIPATAILGFGFHLNEVRPVAPVKHVKNLGLRPNPEPREYKPATPISEMNYKKVPPTQNRLSKVYNRRNTMQGLGLFSPTVSSSSIISEPTADTSSNGHAHGDAQAAEYGFITVPMGNFQVPDPANYNPYVFNQVQSHSIPGQDLRTIFQRQAALEDLSAKPEPKQETTNGVSTATRLMAVGDIMRQGLDTALEENSFLEGNEKEALLENEMKEKDELDIVFGVQAVEPGLDVTDVITQF